MKYKILESSSTHNLETKINSYLTTGWEIQGGISIVATAYRDYTNSVNALSKILPVEFKYLQAIILKEEHDIPEKKRKKI